MSDYELEIDIYNLEEEIKTQPKRFFHYSNLLAEQDQKVRFLKERLEIKEAEADHHIRNTATSKLTEAAIKNMVITDPSVIAINEEYIHAVYEKNILEAAVKAFDQRKGALDNLVKLFTQQYYAEPTEAIMARAATQEARTAALKSKVKIKMSRNQTGESE